MPVIIANTTDGYQSSNLIGNWNDAHDATTNVQAVNSTATNFLAIEVTTTSVNDRIYGGKVTIAAQ